MSLNPPKPEAPEGLTPEEWVARLRSPEPSPYRLSSVASGLVGRAG